MCVHISIYKMPMWLMLIETKQYRGESTHTNKGKASTMWMKQVYGNAHYCNRIIKCCIAVVKLENCFHQQQHETPNCLIHRPLYVDMYVREYILLVSTVPICMYMYVCLYIYLVILLSRIHRKLSPTASLPSCNSNIKPPQCRFDTKPSPNSLWSGKSSSSFNCSVTQLRYFPYQFYAIWFRQAGKTTVHIESVNDSCFFIKTYTERISD